MGSSRFQDGVKSPIDVGWARRDLHNCTFSATAKLQTVSVSISE